MATTPPRPHTTTAFYVQAAASFAVSLLAVGTGIAYLPVSPWVRAFLTVGILYTVTSAFTLATCVRDRQEETAVVARPSTCSVPRPVPALDPEATRRRR